MAERVNLLDMLPDAAESALREFAIAHGQPGYRGTQVAQRLWKNPAPDFASITELPAAFRATLAEHFAIPRLATDAHQRSQDGTQKFLFRLADGQGIETVAIPEDGRLTLCISSQAGCALQCAFCATGKMGFQRNLAAWEIAAQVREMRLLPEPLTVTNVVFMGMGEPLANVEPVLDACTRLHDDLGISARHITVSTVGVVPGILRLAEYPLPVTLAVSLHAPDDELRRTLVPLNNRYPIAEVVDAGTPRARGVV